MSAPARRRATWDDLFDVPEGRVGEIVNGELRVLPRPGPSHTETASDLGMVLGGPFRFGRGGPGGRVIVDEPELALLEDVRVPDLAGWRTERYVLTVAARGHAMLRVPPFDAVELELALLWGDRYDPNAPKSPEG